MKTVCMLICVMATVLPVRAQDVVGDAARNAQLKRELEQERAIQQRAIAASRQWQEDDENQKRRQCGADFGKLRVGMTLDRYEECTEPLDFVSEKVSSAGAVELYRGMFYYIKVLDGKIVGFTRRTR